ncbi:hypothetical protein CANCADRAFT_15279, partial [Tortispora caseinolytica NRRL Y-17796]
EWNAKHFRLFVGNLGPDVSDSVLEAAFAKYSSLAKVKVIMDHRTKTSKGYGFIAFEQAEDYLKAFKEMNGKYVGARPVTLKRATSEL